MALLARTWSVYPSARGHLKASTINIGTHTFKAVLLSGSYTPGTLTATQRSDVAAYALGTDQTVSLSNSSGTVSTSASASWSGSLSPKYVAIYSDTHASDALLCVVDLGGVNGPSDFRLPAQTLFAFDELVASSAEPWYEQTWEFGTADAITSAPMNTWWETGVGQTSPGVGHIHVDGFGDTVFDWDATSAGIDPTGSRSIRLTYGPTGASGGPQIYLPDAATDQPQEIWHEQYIKYASDWDILPASCDGSPLNGHKTIFWFEEGSIIRHEFHIGHQRTIIQWFNNATTRSNDATTGQVDEQTEVWDGTWHRWRFYLKRPTLGDGSDGSYKLWFDDTVLHNAIGTEPYLVEQAGQYFRKVNLAANMNCPPPDEQQMWWGRTRIYTTDPGW